MGIFDFVKDVGKTLSVSMDLSRELSEHNLNVEDLDLKFENGVVTVGGTVKNQEEKEKVILALGNVAGVEKVNETLVVENPESEAAFHTVQPGDTLSKIAKVHYGNAAKYTVIFEANKPMLKDPNKIYVGQVLRIPQE